MGPEDQNNLNIVTQLFEQIPSSLWPYVSVFLAIMLFIANVLKPVWSVIIDFYDLTRRTLRKLFGRRLIGDSIPMIEHQRADVLRDVWLRPVSVERKLERPTSKTKIPVISVLNMKGGVGKTTLTANLGAAFLERGNKVLLIDFDYQGTLSIMYAAAAEKAALKESASLLLRGGNIEEIFKQIETLICGSGVSVDLFPAHYSLFRDEMELFANWAAGNEKDIRFSLSNILLSDRVQKTYDMVLIDCGPRFTTSTINALCASSHIIIPSIMDELSGQAVTYLAKELEGHKKDLFPDLKLLGVIPTMVQQDPKPTGKPKFTEFEEDVMLDVSDRLSTWGAGDQVIRTARIPRRVSISKNANNVAYWKNTEVKIIFDRAATLLLERLQNESFRLKK